MRKFMSTVLTAALVFLGSWPIASASIPVPDNVYEWVQSSPRATYYFNKAQLCYAVDEKGKIDKNTLLVATVKTYDPLQIRDVQDKRRWKEMDMTGYDDLAGVAEYISIDLKQHIVTQTAAVDLDSTGTGLETTHPNKAYTLAAMSAKNLDRIFYEAVIDYAKQHNDEIMKRTKENLKQQAAAKAADEKAHK